jgi:prophage regulatory protein
MKTLTDLKNSFNKQSKTSIYQQLEPLKFPLQEPKILRIKQTLAIYPVGRSTLYKMIAEGKFPAPVSLGGARSVGWKSQDVYAFIAALEAKQ